MSKRKLLMGRKIAEALRAGKGAASVMPKGLKRRSLLILFDGKKA
jgi:hypothetical protein